jgi:outer membrane protein OmpA-like peptidoglycan-associated protein
MRSLTFFALVGIFSALIRPLPTQAAVRTARQLSDVHPNYVVIGAFRIYRNATRFTTHAQKDLQLNAKYELNKNRNLYYVYVLNTPDREEAIAEARRLRSESEFTDTWVYSGNLGKMKPGESYSGIDINPMTNRAMDQVVTDSSPPASTNSNVPSLDNSIPADSNSTATGSNNNETPAVSTERPAAEEPDSEIEGKKFFFSLSRALDREKLEGDVDVIDLDKVKKLGTYKGNMDVKVIKPSGKSGKVSLVCEVFGYRKAQREVDYNNPSGDGISRDENGSVVVPFELSRLQKGDIAVMYNVYFFKDAAVMRPESRFEINSLLEMLKENTNYKIKIHGHTNGKANGKIISLDEGNTNFFSLTKTREGFGSAKKLSEERAEVIRNFLVSNGVDASRMQIKAWGGKRPIHDKHSTRAQENVRVEIEILED